MAFEVSLRGEYRMDAGTEEPLLGAWLLERDQPDALEENGELVLEPSGHPITLGVLDPVEIRGFFSLDLDVIEVALPRAPFSEFGGRQQFVDIEFLVDGVLVRDALPAFTVRLAHSGPSFWSFTVPYRTRDPLNPLSWRRRFPSPLQSLGSPLGTADVTIRGVYFHPDVGRITVPLITNGLATSCRLEGQGDASFLTIEGGCGFLRWEERLVDRFVVPPGHGLTRGALARKLATAEGMTGLVLWEGTRSFRELQVVGEPLLRALQEIADADDMTLRMDELDKLVALPQVDVDGRVSWTLREADLLFDAPFGIDASLDGPTRIDIAGTEQVLREEEEGEGIRSYETWEEVESPYEPRFAVAKQNSDGTIAASGTVGSGEQVQITSRIRTKITKDGDTIIDEEVEAFTFYSPEVWRYELDATPEGVDGGDYLTYNTRGYFYDSGVAKNDNAPMYAWERERLVPAGLQKTHHDFNEAGYRVETTTTKHGYTVIQFAIKQRPNPGATFEATNCLTVPVLGNGQAVAEDGTSLSGAFIPGEHYTGQYAPALESTLLVGVEATLLEREVETNEVTEDGFITAIRRKRFAWDQLEGGAANFLYGDGTFRQKVKYEFVLVESADELYQSKDDQASKVTVSRGKGGKLISIRRERLSGFLPRADQKQSIAPAPETFENEDEAEFAANASRTEQRPILYDLKSTALESRRLRRDAREEFQLAENEEDLARRAVTIIRLESAAAADFVLPCNWLLRPGQRAHVRRTELDVDHDVHVIDVEHSRGGAGDAIVTTVTPGRVYLV